MKRFYENRLETWLAGERPKPLVIRGARQVGKSTLVRNFAAERKLDLYEVNLENHYTLERAFAKRDFRQILNSIEGALGRRFNSQNALLFLDEIQATPSALSALRLFFENEGGYFPVVAAGSLLEFSLGKHESSMPVGRIEYLHMGPMTFEEFLEAMGEEFYCSRLQNYHFGEEMDLTTHGKLLNFLREYLAVGGMPEAVSEYCGCRSLKKTQAVQQFILDTYRDDFPRYRRKTSEKVLRLLQSGFDSIPHSIGRKIKFSEVAKGERAADVRLALELLSLARVAHRVFHTSSGGLPLAAQVNEKMFKTLFMDVGLMNRKLGMDWAALSTLDDTRLVNEGGIAEQLVGQQLLYDEDGIQAPQLYYWNREEKNSSAEIDYVISSGDLIVPVEVKAGKSGTMKSVVQFLFEKKLKFAVRFDLNTPSQCSVMANIPSHNGAQLQYTLISYPLYLSGQLPRLLVEFRQSK